MYTFVHLRASSCVRGKAWGKQVALVKSKLFSVGGVGSASSHLDKTRANSESIKLAGVMHTEGRLHPRCAERALTAHTLSGFFIGTQATAQSSALNTTNGKRGNGIFICLSSSGGLLLLIMR